MRLDNTLFVTDNAEAAKQPRYVISIDFDGSAQYFTSHDDIANVPSTPPVVQNVIRGISATSQTLNPDRANATIGSMQFEIVDLNSVFTDLVRTELDTNDVGLRGRTCKFFMGYKSEQDGSGILDGSSTDDNPDFDNFILFQTQIIRSCETKEGGYKVVCADIQRETKKQIFELALTYLTQTISDTDTTIPVLDLSGFEGNFHGTSYTDAPSLNVIYIRLDKTKEIIRCPVSGISGNDFTGVTRGVFGTVAQAVEVDQAQASDRRPKVEEYVYLELPAVKLAYAVLTGVIEGTANVLPSSWHAGVPTSFVRLSDFQNIGDDLWNTADDTAGVVLRFVGTAKQDAKKFLETELYLLLGLFSPVYSDGQLGLKRMVPSLSDSPYKFRISDENVIGTSVLRHDMESVQNNIRVDWNHNGDRFIRSTIIIDSASIARHGRADEKRIGFRGLVGTRFTEQVLRQLLTSLRDMYTGPPLRLDVNGFHLMNPLEVGDACRVELSTLRDFSQPGASLQRTMVIHGMTIDWLKGVKLKMFGSSERADEIPPITASTCLLDAFYSQEGTALSAVSGLMNGNLTNAGAFTLTGSADMNAAASIFYHDGPLTISSATTITIVGNVQLRVKGFLTIDGTITAVGEGLASGASNFDAGQHYYWAADENFGNSGFIGNSQSHGGLLFRYPDDGGIPNWVWCTAGYFTEGLHQAFPNLVLVVSDVGNGSITGIPTDMRGGGGAYGPRAGEKTGLVGRTFQRADGGAGGAGGGALCVICRGGDFGISGEIILDGADSLEPSTFYAEQGGDYDIYGGAGGAGAPGALLWLIDGSAQTFPDLAGHFSAKTGDVPAQFALPIHDNPSVCNRSLSDTNAPRKNMAPFSPSPRISGFDQTGVNFRISFLPCDVTPEDDQADILPPPTGLSAAAAFEGVELSWTNPATDLFNEIEIHASDTDARAAAVIIGITAAPPFIEIISENPRLRFYWIRAVDRDGNVSAFEPDTQTTGASATPRVPATNIIIDPDFDKSGASFSGGFYGLNVKQGTGPSQTGSITMVLGGGANGSNAVDLVSSGGSGSAISQLIALRRHRIKAGNYEFRITYKTQTNTFGGKHEIQLTADGFSDETGGTPVGVGSGNLTLARSVGAFTTISLFLNIPAIDALQYYRFGFADWPGNSLDTLRIDSIFVHPIAQSFGDNVVDSVLEPGLVPVAGAADSGKFLQGDGTWGAPSGSGVDSFEGRTGAVVAQGSDYADVATSYSVKQTFRASVAGAASIRLLEGVDPSAPLDGDVWITTTDIFARIDGVSESLLGGGSAPVDSVFGRTGVVVALLADYDGFFLTPTEGDAAYSMLGHGHTLSDISDSAALAALDTVGTSEIDNDAVTYPKMQNVAADDRLLGNIAGAGGIIAELTPGQVRTMINVEDDSTADQTAGEIESIVDHDNLIGFVLQEHIRWDQTGAEDLHADRFSSGANMADSLLSRPHISDFAVQHQAVAAIATTVINYESGQSILLTMGGVNIGTLTLNNWPLSGRLGQLEFEIAQNATPRTINWPGAVEWVTGIEPDLSSANETYLIHLSTRDGGAGIIGSYAADSSSGVTSVFGRSGAVVALQADYDSFFLTPTEGNAAYSLLGHSHVPADITFAATNRLLGRDTGGGGAGEELTAAAVRTMLNVEDGSTADQTSIVGITGTASQFDAALTADNFAFAGGAHHDAFSDFVQQEHIRWDLTGSEDVHADRFANAPVQTVFGRSGAVVALLADYDSFFLTPTEGDAAYSMLGHAHVPADITFAATNRFLARDSGGGGAGEEITPAAARTMLNVEDGSTADQTSIVGITGTKNQFDTAVTDGNFAFSGGAYHDSFSDFVSAEHIDWSASGAEDIQADRFGNGGNFGGTLNLLDNVLRRPLIDDFSIAHQVVTGVASTTINYVSGQSVLLNLSAANITTLTISNWPATGRLGQIEIEVTQGSTPRTIAWDTVIAGTVEWPGGTEPDLNVANGKFLVLLRSRDGKTTLIGSYLEDVG